jgi:hypothetical protein
LWGRVAVNTAGGFDQITALELLGGDFHRRLPPPCMMFQTWLPLDYIIFSDIEQKRREDRGGRWLA